VGTSGTARHLLPLRGRAREPRFAPRMAPFCDSGDNGPQKQAADQCRQKEIVGGNTVRAVVDETIRTIPLTMPIDWDHPFWVILMGIEHQQIHIETSSVTIRRLPIELVRQHPLWSIYPLAGEAPRNINLEHWASSCPVNHFRFGEFFDVIGNVWQWTETPITGFDGFQVHPYYDDFSTPTFDTQHNLIKGGS
jgi:hypothetical protein